MGVKWRKKTTLEWLYVFRQFSLRHSAKIPFSSYSKVPGGLTLREGMLVMEECHKSGCLESFDLVEVNVDLVTESVRRNRTLEAAHRVIMAAFGSQRGGNMPYPRSKFVPPTNRDEPKKDEP